MGGLRVRSVRNHSRDMQMVRPNSQRLPETLLRGKTKPDGICFALRRFCGLLRLEEGQKLPEEGLPLPKASSWPVGSKDAAPNHAHGHPTWPAHLALTRVAREGARSQVARAWIDYARAGARATLYVGSRAVNRQLVRTRCPLPAAGGAHAGNPVHLWQHTGPTRPRRCTCAPKARIIPSAAAASPFTSELRNESSCHRDWICGERHRKYFARGANRRGALYLYHNFKGIRFSLVHSTSVSEGNATNIKRKWLGFNDRSI